MELFPTLTFYVTRLLYIASETYLTGKGVGDGCGESS